MTRLFFVVLVLLAGCGVSSRKGIEDRQIIRSKPHVLRPVRREKAKQEAIGCKAETQEGYGGEEKEERRLISP